MLDTMGAVITFTGWIAFHAASPAVFQRTAARGERMRKKGSQVDEAVDNAKKDMSKMKSTKMQFENSLGGRKTCTLEPNKLALFTWFIMFGVDVPQLA